MDVAARTGLEVDEESVSEMHRICDEEVDVPPDAFMVDSVA